MQYGRRTFRNQSPHLSKLKMSGVQHLPKQGRDDAPVFTTSASIVHGLTAWECNMTKRVSNRRKSAGGLVPRVHYGWRNRARRALAWEMVRIKILKDLGLAAGEGTV